MQQTIRSIGIDSVEIERFKEWHTYPEKSLRRIFSHAEIAYCLAVQSKSAERFAARFAAREAFLKAFSSAYPTQKFSLLALCKAIQIIKTPHGAPEIIMNWQSLTIIKPSFNCHISWTHTKLTATAIVIIEE